MNNQGVLRLLTHNIFLTQYIRIVADRLIAVLDIRLDSNVALFPRIIKRIEQDRGDHLREAALIKINRGVDFFQFQVQIQRLIFRLLVAHLSDAPDNKARIKLVDLQLERVGFDGDEIA